MLAVLFLALALSMDAFAAALTQGAAARPRATAGGALRIGVAFGAAQGLMPLLGWGLGLAFAGAVRGIDHWLAFALLGYLGARMIRAGACTDEPGAERPPSLGGWALLAAAVATSVDAAAAGVTIPLLGQPVLVVCAAIGAVTLGLSAAGVLLGSAAGTIAGKRAEVFGGLVLIGLGTKILVEHQFLGG